MRRVAIVLVAVLIAAAAPARAWCEASCLATASQTDSAKPHCPTHEPQHDGPAVAAGASADCPVVDSARPNPAARVDLKATTVVKAVPHTTVRIATLTFRVAANNAHTLHQRHTPLRI